MIANDQELIKTLEREGYLTTGKVVRHLDDGKQKKVEVEWPNKQVGKPPLHATVDSEKVQIACDIA